MSRSFTGRRSLSHVRSGHPLAAPRGAALAIALAAASICIVPNHAIAQACPLQSGQPASLPAWNSPLDRRVSLHVHDISLRDALDRLANESGVRLSYTTENIPLDTRVCASFDSLALGNALTLLLRGTAVLPTAAGGDHVVLAPSEAAVGDASVQAPKILDRVVITGNTVETPARRLTVAMNVVSGAQLSRYSEGNLAQALSDAVPGLWVWQSAPTSLLAHYGSIRGSSSFGASYPKIYVDGIELSNPLLITQFAPEMVERIEIIRGPQGAALYGNDAISGVINIVTRHDGSDGSPSAIVRSSVGAASSSFMPRAAITQDHAVTLRGGPNAESGSVSFSSGGVGEYLPGAFVRHTSGSAGFRAVRSNFIATGTARVFSSRSSDPISPMFRDSVSEARSGLVIPESVQEYTAGGTATFIANDVWTNTIVAGFDGSRVSNIPDYHTPLPSASGPAVGSAGGNANLATFRFSSVGKVGTPENLESSLTLSAENSWLDFRSQTATTSSQTGVVTQSSIVRRMTSAGVAQTNFAWHDAAFLTAGLRLERNSSLGATSTYSALPMLGISGVRDVGPVTVKLRSAYGRGIRAATTPIRETAWFDAGQSRLLDLAPEQQSGIETGLDLFVGRTFGLQVTRFDQLASGLIQRVAYAYNDQRSNEGPGGYDRGPGPGSNEPYAPSDRHIGYMLQNVGEITNRGWELKGDLQLSTLTLSGTYSTVDSRVRRVAANYIGDMRVGDRMLEVPARTGSLSGAWLSGGWNSSVTASRSWDWIDYDRVALAGAFSNSTQTDAQLVGQQLRNYWLRYSGVTRLRASLGRTLYRGLSLTINGENLLNRQHGEPDNITVVPGRTVSFGLRAVM